MRTPSPYSQRLRQRWQSASYLPQWQTPSGNHPGAQTQDVHGTPVKAPAYRYFLSYTRSVYSFCCVLYRGASGCQQLALCGHA